MGQDIKASLVDVLLQTGLFTDPGTRDQLLNNIPGSQAIMRDRKTVITDLQMIVSFAVALGRIGAGELALDILQKNVNKFVPDKTEMRDRVRRCFDELRAALEQPTSPDELQTKEAVSDLSFPFANRQNVFDDILGRFAPPHYLLDGPARYGKTELLRALRNRLVASEPKYICGLVSAKDCHSLSELVRKLCGELNIDIGDVLGENIDAQMMGSRFGAALLTNKFADTIKESSAPTKNATDASQTPAAGGVALLFDDIGPNTPYITHELLFDFIPEVEAVLRSVSLFAPGGNRFRVIISGRYLAQFVSGLGQLPLQFSTKVLEPFKYEFVYATARQVLPGLEPERLKQVSALILHLTGGHPGCMAEVLNLYKSNAYTPEKFAQTFTEHIWEKIVRPQVTLVRDGIPAQLRPVFDRLSVYRFFTTRMLKQLREQKAIDYDEQKDVYHLSDELTGTYLYTRENRLLRDAITRRLLVLNLKHSTSPANFVRFCQEAYQMYLSFLDDMTLQDRELWTIECLHQSLQQYANSIETLEQRRRVREDLYARVPQVLQSLIVSHEEQEWKQELEVLVHKMNQDWELQFTINYYLRDPYYTEHPFEELRSRVLAWKKGENHV